MKFSVFLILLVLACGLSKADSYQVDGKTFAEKSDVVRYLLINGQDKTVIQTRHVTLTSKLGFKPVREAKSIPVVLPKQSKR